MKRRSRRARMRCSRSRHACVMYGHVGIPGSCVSHLSDHADRTPGDCSASQVDRCKLCDDCQTIFELGAFRHRYCCALFRTVFLGEPSARSRHLHQAALDGFLAAYETMRPGLTRGDVDRAFRHTFSSRGVRKDSRVTPSRTIGLMGAVELTFKLTTSLSPTA
ncbi:M24 family metallopeptidase [Bradyrhizobium sp. 142]|nr:M24 family metallopeptidase [Bradyrhizobium sp. 142]